MIGKADMYHYRADFIHEGTLRLHLMRDQIIIASELDPYPIRMLQQHEVPHMLKPYVRIINEEVSLHYEISGKRLLVPLLAVEKINELQYYEWLLQLISIVENCRAYMLQPNQLLFHEDVLFIDGGLQGGKLYIPYVPLIEPINQYAAVQGLQKLAISLSGEVKQWSGNGFQELIRLLHQEGVSFSQLRSHVQSYIVRKPQLHESKYAHEEQRINHHDRSKAIVTMMHEPAPLASNISQPSSDHWWGEHQIDVEEDSEEEINDLDQELEPQPQSWIIAGGITALITAVGLKLGRGQDASGVGITISLLFVVIGVSVGYIWRTGWLMLWIHRQIGKNKSRVTTDDSFIPDMASVELTSLLSKRSKSIKTKVQDDAHTESYVKHHEKKLVASKDLYSNPRSEVSNEAIRYTQSDAHLGLNQSLHTTMLSDSSSATILLEDCEQSIETIKVMLERLVGGKVSESFEVTQFPFTIGRSDQGVHLTINDLGISKLHCELHYDKGQYWIQDLGSKNGTMVCGDLLIPYKKTSISSNDIIKLAHSEYRFTNA